MKRYYKIFMIVALVLTLYSCHHHSKKNASNKQSVITVSAHPLTTTLYYSGIIEPFKTMVITSPADGVIQEMNFHYGDTIKSDQQLFTITSEKFETDYKNALLQYIKAKTDFNNSAIQLKESEFLHKNQLVSDDDYKAKQTGFYTAQLAMIQAREALNAMVKQIDLKGLNLDDLKIENIDKITQLLKSQSGKQYLKISSSVEGVVLLPSKGDGGGDLKHINKGDQVKQGDVLAVIGRINGITIHINVSEFNINQLKIGQKVQVTGAAFSEFTLQGEIAGIDRQAQSGANGLPTFPVEVIVPTLTAAQQERIHMGMSAKIAIEAGDSKPEITVPIQAVLQKNGQSYVTVQDKSGKEHEVAVKTGQTTADSVVIESNLTEGDKVVIPN